VAAGCAFRGCPILRTSSRRHLRLKGDVNSAAPELGACSLCMAFSCLARAGAVVRARAGGQSRRPCATAGRGFLSMARGTFGSPNRKNRHRSMPRSWRRSVPKGPRHLPGRQRRGQTGAGGPCRAVQDTDSWCGAAAPSACPPSLTAVGARCGSGGPLGLGRLVLLRRLG